MGKEKKMFDIGDLATWNKQMNLGDAAHGIQLSRINVENGRDL